MPTYVSKFLAAASSTGVGSFSSAGVVTLSGVDLGTGRRIIVWGSSSLGAAGVITGLSETLTPMAETVTTSTAPGGAVATTQDFRKVTGFSIAGVASTTSYLGTNTQGGTPWNAVDTTRNPVNVAFAIDVTSPSTVTIASLEYTFDYPSFDYRSQLWEGSNPTKGPQPTISSLGSSVTADTVGIIAAPIAAWRLTITSTSSGAGSVAATVEQSGV